MTCKKKMEKKLKFEFTNEKKSYDDTNKQPEYQIEREWERERIKRKLFKLMVSTF